ncbi:MAG: Fe-S cluster assembly protein SufB [Gemmatimonadetes bacterium]|nr:Fe-S cluster assembly protein SufB [Gemmatimonadota bacterium]
MPQDTTLAALNLDEYKFGFRDEDTYVYKSERGLSRRIVEQISSMKEEPEWMLKRRLKALDIYDAKPVPKWGGDLSTLDMDRIYFYVRPADRESRSWDDVPEDIKRTFDRLGIPEAERRSLSGVGAQYESEMVYHRIKDELSQKGVIFDSIEDGLRNHPDLFKRYFGTIVPASDNKYAALNAAVWSGGSFIYVPPGVEVEVPLQAYFRVNTENLGQFERTLIIADEGAKLHYIEGCTAPTYSTDSFHSGVIEIVVSRGANVRYTTIQNWSKNMYNLVTQRARVESEGRMAWTDGNLGSKLTMKYPSCFLVGPGASGEILSIAYAGPGQHQDAGGKMVHAAPHTTSEIISKSISKGSGRSTYRGLLKVHAGAVGSVSNVQCDALLLDEAARTDTYPYIEIEEQNASIGHEATVTKIGDEQLFYLMSRGIPQAEARTMIVRGFIEPIARELPLEYAVELNRLIEFEMEGSVG